MTCAHENFSTKVGIHRMSAVEGGPVTNFTADIAIHCVDCNMPFEFIGVAVGLSGAQPMTSVDGQELRAPIKPAGSIKPPAYPGFRVGVRV
jgi:hypothetical protein